MLPIHIHKKIIKFSRRNYRDDNIIRYKSRRKGTYKNNG